MERLDKILSEAGVCSRRDCEKLVRRGLITINGQIVKSASEKADENASIEIDGELVQRRREVVCIMNKPAGFVIMVPQNREWAELIENVYPGARKVTRYAIKKDTRFDVEALKKNLQLLPDGYELKPIDDRIYDLCLENPVTADFVSVFESKEKYLKEGRGVVILKDGRIVSGASSYTRYKEGIEIEVDTAEEERRRHFALIVCSALILRCLGEGLYPSWDAHNMGSVHLAEKLGYEFDHEYTAYEVASDERTH